MGTASRKQREYEQREAQILDAARECLVSEGYLKLNMDRIGQAIEFAKGTVYRHFHNKEDIVVALGIRTFEAELELFARASAYDGLTRERFVATGVAASLHYRLFPEHLQITQICSNPAIFDKARPPRQERMRDLEGKCMRMIAGICRDAIETGDLVLDDQSITPEVVVFGPWAAFTGAQFIMDAKIPMVEHGIADAEAALWWNVERMVDGMGWKPLACEHDYEEVRQRATEELFAAEVAQVAATSTSG